MTVDYDANMMLEALSLAEDAIQYGEIPVACLLVGDSGRTVTSSQTMVRRKGSMVAHGELFAILEAGDLIWSSGTLVLYTTLEPCLMCLGACAQAEIDTVYYGMRAKPDGAGWAAAEIGSHIANVPSVSGGYLEDRSVALMHQFLAKWPSSPALPYVEAMLDFYNDREEKS